jgi:hypothetical protein
VCLAAVVSHFWTIADPAVPLLKNPVSEIPAHVALTRSTSEIGIPVSSFDVLHKNIKKTGTWNAKRRDYIKIEDVLSLFFSSRSILVYVEGLTLFRVPRSAFQRFYVWNASNAIAA